jgi:UDP-N-acetyl-D-mannosaminuronate dehydrogenase
VKTDEIERRATAAREAGAECVVVLGLGFVGTAVAANLSRTSGPDGAPLFFVIGLDLDAARAARLDQGRAPTYANDPSLEEVIARACRDTGNLVGTTDERCLAQADVVVSCINLDLQREPGQTERLGCNTEGYAAAMRTIRVTSRKIRSSSLRSGSCVRR